MTTLFNDRRQAEALRDQVAADDADWAYLVEPIQHGHFAPAWRVAVVDETGQTIGHL